MSSSVITTSITASIAGAPAGLFQVTGAATLTESLDASPYATLTVDVIVPAANRSSVYLNPKSAPRRLEAEITTTRDGVSSVIVLGLYLREVRWTNFLTGAATLTAKTWEVGFDDRVRLSNFMVDTGAANLQALVNWARTDTAASITGFPTSIAGTAPLASVALPDGVRRQWMPTQTMAQLFEGELQAQGGRIRGTLAGGLVYESANRPDPLTALAVFADSLISLTRTVSREGDWGDGVLVKFQYVNSSGVMTTDYQRSGGGVHSKAVQVTETKAPPTTNVADQMLTRVLMRGDTTTAQMPLQLDLGIDIGRRIEIYEGATIGGARLAEGQVRARTISLPDATMTLELVA